MNFEELDQHLICILEDNGDWEYTREGIGSINGRVFIVDLNDTGEEPELQFVKEGMQVHQVLAIGKNTGRYVQEESGTFYYDWDNDGDREITKSFCKQVGLAVPDWIN